VNGTETVVCEELPATVNLTKRTWGILSLSLSEFLYYFSCRRRRRKRRRRREKGNAKLGDRLSVSGGKCH